MSVLHAVPVSHKPHHLASWKIGVIAVGGLFGVLLVALLAVLFLVRQKHRAQDKTVKVGPVAIAVPCFLSLLKVPLQHTGVPPESPAALQSMLNLSLLAFR